LITLAAAYTSKVKAILLYVLQLVDVVGSQSSKSTPVIATGPFLLAVTTDHAWHAHGMKTTVSVAWVGTRGKGRLCPSVVSIFVGLLPAVEGQDDPGEYGR